MLAELRQKAQITIPKEIIATGSPSWSTVATIIEYSIAAYIFDYVPFRGTLFHTVFCPSL